MPAGWRIPDPAVGFGDRSRLPPLGDEWWHDGDVAALELNGGAPFLAGILARQICKCQVKGKGKCQAWYCVEWGDQKLWPPNMSWELREAVLEFETREFGVEAQGTRPKVLEAFEGEHGRIAFGRSASSMPGAVRCPTGDSCHYCFGQAVFVFESAEVSSPEPDDAAAAAVAATDGGSSKKKTRLSKRQRAKMKAASAS